MPQPYSNTEQTLARREGNAITNPTIVLLPGMDGTGDLFAPLIDALDPEIQTVVVRYPDVPLYYAGHERIVRAQLPTDRPYIILGESFSGPIAISIAATLPPGLRGYVLCASFARSPRAFLKALKPTLGWISPHRIPFAVAEFFLMGRHGTPALRQAYTQTLQRVSSATLTARLKAMADVDVCEPLARIQIPGIYLRATEDRLVPASASRIFTKRAPAVRIVDIEGPHFLLQANPAAAADALLAFIRDRLVHAHFGH